MKIAFVGLKGIPATFGGVEKHVEELGSRLVQKGHSIVVYTRNTYNRFKGSYKGMRIISLPALPQKHTEMISHTLLSLLSLIGRDVEVVHIHSTDPALLSFIPRVQNKVVVTSHGQAYRRGKWGSIAKALSRLAERAFVSFPHKRIAVSKTLKKYYEEKYSCEVQYIPNGVEVKSIGDTSSLVRLGLSKDDYVLFVGRIIPTKGCDILIDAFNKVKTGKKLVIVGGGSYTNAYVENLKKSANERTQFLGYRYGEELDQLYAHAYCCIVPSEVEGLAMTLLEAMAYGRCVIYSDIPENVEVACDAGISFHNRDSSDLAEKLRVALNNPSYCRELEQKARERVFREYNWAKIVVQTEEVYKSLFI